VTLNARPPFAQVTVLPNGPTLGSTPLTAEFDRRVDRVELQFSLNGMKQDRIATAESGEILVEFPESRAAAKVAPPRPRGTPKSKKKKTSP
jgi:hypothetical protein